MPRRLALALVLALGLLAGGCGTVAHRAPATAPAAATAPAVPAPPEGSAAGPLKAASWRAAALLAARRAAARRAELARLAASPTVAAALRRAAMTGRIGRRELAGMRTDWARAQALAVRLPGVRGAELGAVAGEVRALAAAHALTPARVVPVFLGLRRNVAFWPRAPLPAPRFRTTFGTDPAVFQYYPGHGLQLQPLASWGQANGLARDCLDVMRTLRGHPCRVRALRAMLDRLSALAARRAGYLAWEYYFPYGGGSAPWVSGMTQATAAQALARGARALGVRRWRRAALAALGAFEHQAPAGVATPAPGGTRYAMYSFAPGLRILNGELQAVTGLRDLAELTRSPRARRLFRAGERAARADVAGFDTGAWSLYSSGGRESTLAYHDLLAGFLQNLCGRTHERAYCRTAARFKRYEREPTRIGLRPLRRLRARRPAPLRFSLSKVSAVRVRLWGAGGLTLDRRLELPRGRHAVEWAPPRRGHYHVRIDAQGPSGPLAVLTRSVSVVLPRPHRHRRARTRQEACVAASSASPACPAASGRTPRRPGRAPARRVRRTRVS